MLEPTRNDLVHVKTERDGRCVDMLLTIKEVERGVDRAINPKNLELIEKNCCTCWPVEKPPKCTFWERILNRCEKTKE